MRENILKRAMKRVNAADKILENRKVAQMIFHKMMTDESVIVISQGMLIYSNKKRFDTIN